MVDGMWRQNPLVQTGIGPNVKMQALCQGLGGLPGTPINAGDDGIDRKRTKETRQFESLALTGISERRVRLLAGRLAVPDKDQGGHGVG